MENKEQEYRHRLKVTCLTPRGKAEKASKNFGMRFLSMVKKPIETVLVSDSEFYYIYEYKKEKDMLKVLNKKIPKGAENIRGTYMLIIHLVDKGNKMAKKGAWGVERVRRWIFKQLRKKVANPREFEDFIDAIDMSDRDEIMQFLVSDIISGEILGGEK